MSCAARELLADRSPQAPTDDPIAMLRTICEANPPHSSACRTEAGTRPAEDLQGTWIDTNTLTTEDIMNKRGSGTPPPANPSPAPSCTRDVKRTLAS